MQGFWEMGILTEGPVILPGSTAKGKHIMIEIQKLGLRQIRRKCLKRLSLLKSFSNPSPTGLKGFSLEKVKKQNCLLNKQSACRKTK